MILRRDNIKLKNNHLGMIYGSSNIVMQLNFNKKQYVTIIRKRYILFLIDASSLSQVFHLIFQDTSSAKEQRKINVKDSSHSLGMFTGN